MNTYECNNDIYVYGYIVLLLRKCTQMKNYFLQYFIHFFNFNLIVSVHTTSMLFQSDAFLARCNHSQWRIQKFT